MAPSTIATPPTPVPPAIAQRIRFSKMQGAGNDFVVLDETAGRLHLNAAQYRFLGDRHFGVGADQILSVRPSPGPGIDFAYVIHNNDGQEVEHCGNGARCFVRFVREHGLTHKDVLRVQVAKGILELHMLADGRVTVDMGPPEFGLAQLPFNPAGLQPVSHGNWEYWPLALPKTAKTPADTAYSAPVFVALVSMGNPHAVQLVNDVDTAPVASIGPLVESHAAFPRRVNAGFMQVQSRSRIKLRVYERGAGETLACGTGACAAVVAGIRWGLLDAAVDVETRGGLLRIEWAGAFSAAPGAAPATAPEATWASVRMTGPATTVFEGEISVPALP